MSAPRSACWAGFVENLSQKKMPKAALKIPDFSESRTEQMNVFLDDSWKRSPLLPQSLVKMDQTNVTSQHSVTQPTRFLEHLAFLISETAFSRRKCSLGSRVDHSSERPFIRLDFWDNGRFIIPQIRVYGQKFLSRNGLFPPKLDVGAQ